MGTSANLLIKSGNKTLIHRTRYDGHPDTVFGNLISTLAVVGVEGLKGALERATVFDSEDYQDETVGLQKGFDLYLEAAERQNRDPFMLFDTVKSFKAGEYYAVDFAHCGVIALFADPQYNLRGWGDENECDYELDLNEGTLLTKWEPSIIFTLKEFEGKDSEAILALFQSDRFRNLSDEDTVNTFNAFRPDGIVDGNLALKTEIEALPNAKTVFSDDIEISETASRRFFSSAASEDQIHVFYAHPQDQASIIYMATVIQNIAPNIPNFNIEKTLKMDLTGQQHGNVLVVDLTGENRPSVEVSELFERLGGVVLGLGLNYEYRSHQGYSFKNQSSSIASSGTFSSGEVVSSGDLYHMREERGAPVLDPTTMTKVVSRHERLTTIQEDVAANAHPEKLKSRALLAIAMADQEVLNLLPQEAVNLDAEEWNFARSLFNGMSLIEEVLDPGARKARWKSFDSNLAHQMLEGLSGVDRRLMENELGVKRKSHQP